MELIKDYNISILHHPVKANMAADAMSRKLVRMESLVMLEVSKLSLMREEQFLSNGSLRLQETNNV